MYTLDDLKNGKVILHYDIYNLNKLKDVMGYVGIDTKYIVGENPYYRIDKNNKPFNFSCYIMKPQLPIQNLEDFYNQLPYIKDMNNVSDSITTTGMALHALLEKRILGNSPILSGVPVCAISDGKSYTIPVYTIEDLRAGKCIIYVDQSTKPCTSLVNKLNEVLKAVDIESASLNGNYCFYRYEPTRFSAWVCNDSNIYNLPAQDVTIFHTQLTQSTPTEDTPKIYTIQDLAEGKVVLINDGTVEELRRVTTAIDGYDKEFGGVYKYYKRGQSIWVARDKHTEIIPTQSVKIFIKELNNKNMKYTIQDLADGKVAAHHDGLLEDLQEFLKKAFPKDDSLISGVSKYYSKNTDVKGHWYDTDSTNLPSQSVKDFLQEKTFPRVMWVNHLNDINTAFKRVVFMQKNGRFISWRSAETLEDAQEQYSTSAFHYAWEIKEKTIFPFNLKPELAQKIIDMACTTWKEKLSVKWAKQIVLKQDITITEEDYNIMYKACNDFQKKEFDVIFK